MRFCTTTTHTILVGITKSISKVELVLYTAKTTEE